MSFNDPASSSWFVNVGNMRSWQVTNLSSEWYWPAVEEMLDRGEGVLETDEALKDKVFQIQSSQMILQEYLHEPDIPFTQTIK